MTTIDLAEGRMSRSMAFRPIRFSTVATPPATTPSCLANLLISIFNPSLHPFQAWPFGDGLLHPLLPSQHVLIEKIVFEADGIDDGGDDHRPLPILCSIKLFNP